MVNITVINQKSIANQSNINRKSIENQSNIHRKSIAPGSPYRQPSAPASRRKTARFAPAVGK